MFRPEQAEQVLGARCDAEEHVGITRRVDRVGRSLRGQQRRTTGRERERPRRGYLRARQDHRGAHPRVAVGRIVGDREGRVAAVGLARDGDVRTIDEPGEGPGARAGGLEHLRDDEAHVTRLIGQIRLVRPAGRIGVLAREHGRRHDIARPRPALQQAPVERRRDREAVSEDDERKRPGGARRRSAQQICASGGSERRVADVGQQRARLGRSVGKRDRAAGVGEPQDSQADSERGGLRPRGHLCGSGAARARAGGSPAV